MGVCTRCGKVSHDKCYVNMTKFTNDLPFVDGLRDDNHYGPWSMTPCEKKDDRLLDLIPTPNNPGWICNHCFLDWLFEDRIPQTIRKEAYDIKFEGTEQVLNKET
jgi:hypothetical protein